jgi:hypothetical protein
MLEAEPFRLEVWPFLVIPPLEDVKQVDARARRAGEERGDGLNDDNVCRASQFPDQP